MVIKIKMQTKLAFILVLFIILYGDNSLHAGRYVAGHDRRHGGEGDNSKAVTIDEIVKTLEEYYSNKGIFQIRKKHRDYILILIDDIRNEIIQDESFWERIEVLIAFIGDSEFLCIVDGQFAPGLGEHLPKNEQYSDMEPKYSDQLDIYTDKLMLKFNTKREDKQ